MTKDERASWATLSWKTTSVDNAKAQKYTLSTTEKTIIGRSPECQISLDPHEYITVSRRHAEIKLLDANWQINDLGTTNGTLVNDRPIENPQQLESGDRITLGSKGPEFTFECLTLNATVVVKPMKMEVASPPLVKLEASPKLENKPVPTADAIAEAKKTIPASREAQPAAELSQPPIAKPIPEPAPKPEKAPVAELRPEPAARQEIEPKQKPSLEPKEETRPKAAVNTNISKAKAPPPVVENTQNPAPANVQPVNSGKTLWSLVSISQLCQISGHSQPVLSLAFSPDGQILASTAKDKTIKLWSVAEGAEIATLTGHKLAPNAVVFSPDGQILASGGADKTIKLWNVASQEETASFAAHKLAINALAFSPDGQILASGSRDKTIKLWNLASKEETATLSGHKQGISAIGFSPDGQTIASAGADQTIKLWNKKTQSEIVAIATPSWQTGAIAITADGQTFAGSNEQGAIKLWQI